MFDLTKISTGKAVAKAYNTVLDNVISELTDKLHHAQRNIAIYERFILDNESSVWDNEILRYIKAKQNGTITNYNKFKIEKLYKINNNDVNSTKLFIHNLRLRGNITNENNKLLYSYYSNFMKYVILENNLDLRIEMFENLRFNETFISKLFRLYFNNISELLLTGRSYSLPFSIIIKVLAKDVRYSEKKYGKQRNIDWNESLITLKAIAKELAPELYNMYISKKIKKKDFINSMQKYTYNKDTNPNGKKWLVRRVKDYNLWLLLTTKFCSLDLIHGYGIVPTNFILNETRSQIDFTNNVKSVKEIIESKLLGFRDKLRALERFDIDYCTNTFENTYYDIQLD